VRERRDLVIVGNREIKPANIQHPIHVYE
jgi:hypothetical protein